MRHERPHRFVSGQRGFYRVTRDRFTMRYLSYGNVTRLWVKRVGRQIFAAGGFHAYCQAIDDAKSTISEGESFIARQDRAQCAVQSAPTCTCNTESVGVAGTEYVAQHVFGFDQPTQYVFVHVIRNALSAERVEHTRIGVPRSRTRGQGIGDSQGRVDTAHVCFLEILRTHGISAAGRFRVCTDVLAALRCDGETRQPLTGFSIALNEY